MNKNFSNSAKVHNVKGLKKYYIGVKGQPTIYYGISVKVVNGSYDGDEYIGKDAEAKVIVKANDKYVLPDSISVENAKYNYIKDEGVIELSNPVGDISIIVECVEG